MEHEIMVSKSSLFSGSAENVSSLDRAVAVMTGRASRRGASMAAAFDLSTSRRNLSGHLDFCYIEMWASY